jgi:hypothetical protein
MGYCVCLGEVCPATAAEFVLVGGVGGSLTLHTAVPTESCC